MAKRIAKVIKKDDPLSWKEDATTELVDNEEEDLYSKAKFETIDDPRCLNIWIRADTHGSIEALETFLYEV